MMSPERIWIARFSRPTAVPQFGLRYLDTAFRFSATVIGRVGARYLSQTIHQTAAHGRVFVARSNRNKTGGRLKVEGGRRSMNYKL